MTDNISIPVETEREEFLNKLRGCPTISEKQELKDLKYKIKQIFYKVEQIDSYIKDVLNSETKMETGYQLGLLANYIEHIKTELLKLY